MIHWKDWALSLWVQRASLESKAISSWNHFQTQVAQHALHAPLPQSLRHWAQTRVTPVLPSFQGQTLSWKIREQVLEIEMHRQPCNEIGLQTLDELEKLVPLLYQEDLGIRAALFYSSIQGCFSAGADLRALYEGVVQRKAQGQSLSKILRSVRRFLDRIHRVFNRLDAAPIPVLMATQGVVFGGGFEWALTADLIIADKSSRFAFPELRLGLIPGFGGIPRLERSLGNAPIRDLLFSGRSLNAKKAQSLGLVSQVVARGRALEVARRSAAQIQKFHPLTTRIAKSFVKPLPLKRLEKEKDTFCQLFLSPVVLKALKRFVESSDIMPYLP